MKNHAIQANCYAPRFRVIPGYQEQQDTIKKMIEACWLTAYVALWNGVFFSTDEQENAKKAIKRILVDADNLQAGYVVVIERILLSRRKIRTDIEPLMQAPQYWFSPVNKKGFERSALWYTELQQRRANKPLYGLALKGFADAVLEMCETPCSKSYHYWRSYFAGRNKQGLLNLLLAVTNHLENNRP